MKFDVNYFMNGTTVRVEFGDATTGVDIAGAHAVSKSFPHTYGQPLAHFLKAAFNVPDAQIISDQPAIRMLNIQNEEILGQKYRIRLRSCNWKPIIDKFHNRLSSWKVRSISFGGRLTLLKSVLEALGTYYFSLFKAPKCVIIYLEKLRRNFFWGGSVDNKKLTWEKESNEFINSSVENLVPSLSESKDLSDSECDVPAHNDFITFSNLLFDADDDFSSSDDKSFSDEDISKKIYSNPLFDEEIISIKIDVHHFNAESDFIESLLNQDSSIISFSSKIDSLLDEFACELILLKSIPSGIDEADCDPEEEIHLIEKLLYDNSSPRPPEEFNSEDSDAIIESFSPSPIPVEHSDPFMKDIDLFLASDGSIPPGIDSDYSDSKRDNLFLKRLLHDDLIPLLENESFHFDIPSSPRPPAKPPDYDEIEPNSEILTVKVVGDISE
nr:RNA-directed DNA polymerase, eukaryota, reverse transcriptase zinc-binding domain protein [Tanacetum cinerariifolium]